jgi:Arylsulfotransferase (ASST)
MILGPYGGLVWFDPLSGDRSAADLRVQSYRRKPALTWWQGDVADGVGFGEDVIDNSSYQQVAVVQGGNGLKADLHEFDLTPWGTALITAYYPVIWDASAVRGSRRQVVFDAVVQEIDIPTGLVLFQWDSLDHVPVTDSYEGPPSQRTSPYDYFHVNSAAPDDDGDILISGRNTWAAYKLSHQTGAIVWTLGGKHSSFKIANGVSWAVQYDVRVQSQGDTVVTLFDDGAGPPNVERESRAISLRLDLTSMTATEAAQYVHSPGILTTYEGNFQELPGGDAFVGWGQRPYFTEFNSRGQVVFDARIIGPNGGYRTYKFPWAGTPQTPPTIATSRHRRRVHVYASWNGATSVAAWRVLGGSSASSLRPVRTATKTSFETEITVRRHRYLAVEALGPSGQILGTSAAVRP